MTIVLICIIVLLVVILALMTGACLKNVNLAEYWFGKYATSLDNYEKLEIGRDEESEAYEQQYLSFMDTIENQSKAIDSYIEDLHFLVRLGRKHFEHCLPDLGDKDREHFARLESDTLYQG